MTPAFYSFCLFDKKKFSLRNFRERKKAAFFTQPFLIRDLRDRSRGRRRRVANRAWSRRSKRQEIIIHRIEEILHQLLAVAMRTSRNRYIASGGAERGICQRSNFPDRDKSEAIADRVADASRINERAVGKEHMPNVERRRR